jgi:hypothetical protein
VYSQDFFEALPPFRGQTMVLCHSRWQPTLNRQIMLLCVQEPYSNLVLLQQSQVRYHCATSPLPWRYLALYFLQQKIQQYRNYKDHFCFRDRSITDAFRHTIYLQKNNLAGFGIALFFLLLSL